MIRDRFDPKSTAVGLALLAAVIVLSLTLWGAW